MIERLRNRARAEALSRLQAEVGECQALALDDDVFDVAVSMNGVSLFPDILGGLREMVRVTRPGGQVLVVVFGPLSRAEFIALPLGAMGTTVPGSVPPPGGPPMPPFRLSETAALQRILQEAGASDVGVDTVPWSMTFESVDSLLDLLLTSNPIARQLTSGLTDEQFRSVRQVLDGMLRGRSGGAPGAVLSTEMHIGTATV
jgi:SAM-dependent methyltransferase